MTPHYLVSCIIGFLILVDTAVILFFRNYVKRLKSLRVNGTPATATITNSKPYNSKSGKSLAVKYAFEAATGTRKGRTTMIYSEEAAQKYAERKPIQLLYLEKDGFSALSDNLDKQIASLTKFNAIFPFIVVPLLAVLAFVLSQKL